MVHVDGTCTGTVHVPVNVPVHIGTMKRAGPGRPPPPSALKRLALAPEQLTLVPGGIKLSASTSRSSASSPATPNMTGSSPELARSPSCPVPKVVEIEAEPASEDYMPHQNAPEAMQGSWYVNLLRELDRERALVKKIMYID